jgi:cobyrinic acid a,c-diamide synthase
MTLANDKARRCPALLISAPASGQGKTTVTAALARYYQQRGLRVRIFKVGPDFLDPMVLEKASGAPVYQLDLWMAGESHCRQLLWDAAGQVDLILIEGVMGLFDGDRSSADLAKLFQIPVLAVIDASAMAQTFGALAYGLAHYQADLPFAGVFANRVASQGHYQMLAESLKGEPELLGWLARDEAFVLPERHLGIVQADELEDLDTKFTQAASSLQGMQLAVPPPSRFTKPEVECVAPLLDGVRIAVARDTAFAFLYRANIELLQTFGAEVIYFSPLADQRLPEVDALYLPGGYPELHLPQLASNTAMKDSIHAHHKKGRPILAECGGMLYLLESLIDRNGLNNDMVGLLPGQASMQKKLGNIGLHKVELPEGVLRGHTFHYSTMTCAVEPIVYSQATRVHGTQEPVYRQGRLTASYFHHYFPSNPRAAAKLFLP